LYFDLFSASFCTTFLSEGTASSISVFVFSFFFNYYIWPICCYYYYYYYYYYLLQLSFYSEAVVLTLVQTKQTVIYKKGNNTKTQYK
jgi:hypothetical protein